MALFQSSAAILDITCASCPSDAVESVKAKDGRLIPPAVVTTGTCDSSGSRRLVAEGLVEDDEEWSSPDRNHVEGSAAHTMPRRTFERWIVRSGEIRDNQSDIIVESENRRRLVTLSASTND